ncbi:hypothetical protein [Phreatobacter sp.]|uniref:hypothetical protein n=1 Tax=Phreatobacter sp. TaxID=1966341 RepID=UPI003F72B4A9
MPPLDVAKVLTRKQEHECARLDDFEFRVRIRAIRLLVDDLNERTGIATPLDALAFARQAANERVDATLAAIDAALGAASPGPGTIFRRHGRAVARAYEQVIVERGDPSPFRMA